MRSTPRGPRAGSALPLHPRPTRYVTIEKFAEHTGYTADAVRKKRERGVWLEGQVVRKAPDGRILIDLEEFERWVESQGSV